MFNELLAALSNLKQGWENSLSQSGNPSGPIKEGRITSVVYANRKWRVRVAGSEWFAESVQPSAFNVGDFVQIVGRRSATTLLIRPQAEPLTPAL